MVSEIYEVLYNCGGLLLYCNLEGIYRKAYGKNVDLAGLEVGSLADFILSFRNFFTLKTYKKKQQLTLNKELAGN